MFTLEHVFVPLDFSPCAKRALRTLELLTPQTFTIQPVHALGPWPLALELAIFPYAALGEDTADLEHQWAQATEELLWDFFDLHPDQLPPSFAPPRVILGQPFDALPAEIARTNADLVVMGAFGQSGVRPEVLGATATAMVHSTTRPLLLIKSPTSTRIRRILCALDLSSQSAQVLDVTLGIGALTQAQCTSVFVLPDPLAQDPHGLLEAHLRYKPEEILKRERSKIDALFERAYQEIEVPFAFEPRFESMRHDRHVLHGEPARTLLEYADAQDIDLIVLGTRSLSRNPSRHGRIGQVCWDVARRSTAHVLIVPIEPVANLLHEDEG